MDAHDPNELVGSAEIARRLGVKPRTVILWTQKGLGFPDPATKNGRYLYRWGTVAEWYERRLEGLSAGPRARVEGKGQHVVTNPLPPAEETKLRRELVAVSKRLASAEKDRARLIELCAVLHDRGGLTWQQLADITGFNRAMIRKAVERSTGRP
jgi:DNA-binding transcriptional MerR regulator